MDSLVRNLFERERDRISAKSGPEIARIGAEMNERGIFYGGAHVTEVFKVYSNSSQQIVGALVSAYKTVAQETSTSPTAATVAEAKSEVGILVEMQIRKIRQEMLVLTKHLNSGPGLTQEVERWSTDLQNKCLIGGGREIDIWSEIEARKKIVAAAGAEAAEQLIPQTPVSSTKLSYWKRILQHPWVPGIATNAIGQIVAVAVLAVIGFICNKEFQNARKADNAIQTGATKLSNPSTEHHSKSVKIAGPVTADAVVNAGTQEKEKAIEIARLQAIQHIDRALEDGRAGIADAQALFQQKFDEGISSAAKREVSGSTIEQGLLYGAMQAGQTKADEVNTKTKRAIEDEMIKLGLVIPDMSNTPWLQSEALGFAQFKKQVDSAKEGMAATIRGRDRQRRTHL